MDRQHYIDFFNSYTDKYLEEAESETETIHLTRKKEHSLRVVDYAMDIAKHLELEEDELDLIFLISLFHDIGRFEQFKKYRTFSDAKSINHAKQSVIVINEHDLFSEFNEDVKESMNKCVLAHNAKDIPDYFTLSEFLYCSILRDADKLDGIYAFINIIPKLSKKEQAVFYSSDIEGTEVSEGLYDAIMNQDKIDLSEIKSALDKKVFLMGNISSSFVNRRSFEIINQQNFLEDMLSLIPITDKVKMIYDFEQEYVHSMID